VSESEYTIRRFRTLEEYHSCVRLQEEVWGQGFSERVPVAILKVSQRLGGLAAGAWDRAGTLQGFVFGMTGLEDGRPVHWSDMLAVRPGLRDAGLGRLLKRYQRDELLAIGVNRVYWTFDPLESRNAYLNLVRLGAVSREYVRDMYGQTDSPLHGGIGTDRFVARWDLESSRVRQRMEGTGVRSVVEPEGAAVALGPGPDTPRLDLDDLWVTVAIPSEIQKVKAENPALAGAWREATRAVFIAYLERGYQVQELVRRSAYSTYVLRRVTT